MPVLHGSVAVVTITTCLPGSLRLLVPLLGGIAVLYDLRGTTLVPKVTLGGALYDEDTRIPSPE